MQLPKRNSEYILSKVKRNKTVGLINQMSDKFYLQHHR